MTTELLYNDHEGVEVIARGGVSHNGDNLDVLHYRLNPAEFISLPAKERAKILAAVLGGGLDDVVNPHFSPRGLKKVFFAGISFLSETT